MNKWLNACFGSLFFVFDIFLALVLITDVPSSVVEMSRARVHFQLNVLPAVCVFFVAFVSSFTFIGRLEISVSKVINERDVSLVTHV